MIRVLQILCLIIVTISCKSKSDILVRREIMIGDYVSENQGYNYRLLLDNNEFKYWKNLGHCADFTLGEWKIENGNVILNSKTLSPEDGFTMSLSSANWIIFENKILKISNGKLIDLQKAKLKFRKKLK